MKSDIARQVLAALLFIVGTIFQWGCAGSSSVPEYSSAAVVNSAVSSREKTVEKNGIKASLDPFDDKERCETYFHLNAPAKGIAILHLRVENQSPDTTWILRKEQCKLTLSGTDTSVGTANTQQGTAGGAATTIVGAGLGGVSMIFLAQIGGASIQNSTVVQRNFTEKELKDKSLSPGQSVEGFVYYQLPKDSTSFNVTFQLDMTSTKDQQINTIQIPFNYEKQ